MNKYIFLYKAVGSDKVGKAMAALDTSFSLITIAKSIK